MSVTKAVHVDVGLVWVRGSADLAVTGGGGGGLGASEFMSVNDS